MSKSKKRRVHRDSDDDDYLNDDDELPYMGKKPVAARNEMQGGVNKTSNGLSPELHESVMAALDSSGAEE